MTGHRCAEADRVTLIAAGRTVTVHCDLLAGHPEPHHAHIRIGAVMADVDHEWET